MSPANVLGQSTPPPPFSLETAPLDFLVGGSSRRPQDNIQPSGINFFGLTVSKSCYAYRVPCPDVDKRFSVFYLSTAALLIFRPPPFFQTCSAGHPQISGMPRVIRAELYQMVELLYFVPSFSTHLPFASRFVP